MVVNQSASPSASIPNCFFGATVAAAFFLQVLNALTLVSVCDLELTAAAKTRPTCWTCAFQRPKRIGHKSPMCMVGPPHGAWWTSAPCTQKRFTTSVRKPRLRPIDGWRLNENEGTKGLSQHGTMHCLGAIKISCTLNVTSATTDSPQIHHSLSALDTCKRHTCHTANSQGKSTCQLHNLLNGNPQRAVAVGVP